MFCLPNGETNGLLFQNLYSHNQYTPQKEKDKIMNFIDGVLQHHTALIRKFELLTFSVPTSRE